jgi:molybdopterin-containing oxidoreductase family membrane subunit
MYKKDVRGELILGNKTYGDITNDILRSQEEKAPLWWWGGFILSIILMAIGLGWAVPKTIMEGIGVWGNNNQVPWGWAIINFVWWIGIGHAGTAFSIFLLVFRQKWRTSINRAAEAMTVFAVLAAGLFPAIHVGRAWDEFFIFPYGPNSRGLWVNFNSPLLWDVFAILTYLTTSAIFWYIGMLPDFATVRDRSTGIKRKIFNAMSLGWVGKMSSWRKFEDALGILGGLAMPLVIAVHSIVSTDFSAGVLPGWHETIFPPFFVVGAIFSGFSMVVTLMTLIRVAFKLEDYVTDDHFDAIARIITFVSLIMGSAYLIEVFIAWYSANVFEDYVFVENYAKFSGHYSVPYWLMIVFNAFLPQLFWFKKIRRSLTWIFIITIGVNIGMWLERYNIVVPPAAEDFLPAAWFEYSSTIVDKWVYLGTMGLFLFGVFLFIRFIPMMAMNELKQQAKRHTELKPTKEEYDKIKNIIRK